MEALKLKILKIFLVLFVFVISISTGVSQDLNKLKTNHPNVHKVIVDSVLQTTSYTYLLVKDASKLVWLAIPKREAEKDEVYYFQGGMEMKDFKSKELNRVFSSVLFLDGVVSPEELKGEKNESESSSTDEKSKTAQSDLTIPPPVNGITLGELFKNKKNYNNKIVRVRGKVTKYNSGIMSKNWIHIKDGSADSSDFDFTATSTSEAIVGEIITLEGKIVLDKDFGSGYKFVILMEDGKITR